MRYRFPLRLFVCRLLPLWAGVSLMGWPGGTGWAQLASSAAEQLCPSPALARVQSHRVSAGETLESIAAAYQLLPLTILALNPTLQGRPRPGMTLRIPPFNGAEVAVRPGQTWQDLAATYHLRADILFEVNGCPETVPERIFVPGVRGLLDHSAPLAPVPPAETTPLTGYPLAIAATLVGNYGWRTHPRRDALVFSSGVTLAAPPATAVLAVGAGTVAHVGEPTPDGRVIVINHPQGLQTRYGGVTDPQVEPGDRVQTDQRIASLLPTAPGPATLYFEVRVNSALGWVARDPGDYIPALAVR